MVFHNPVKGFLAQAVRFIILMSNIMLWRLFHVKSLPIQPTGTSKPRFWKHSSTYKLSTSLQGNKWIPAPTQVNLTLSTLSWVFIFSILICIHFCGANMKNLFIYYEPLLLEIIPFIIMTSMFDSALILGANYS